MAELVLSDLAAKYARQVAIVEDLWRTAELAKANMAREQQALDETAKSLKTRINRERPQLLIPIGFGRYVLVHSTNGSFGLYASIDIIEEAK